MIGVVRIDRRRRIARGEGRRRGLADNGRSRLLQHLNDRRIRARLPALVDRRAHLGRKIRRVDDVLESPRDAAQRPGTRRARAVGTADKSANGFLMRADRLKRLADRRIRRKIAGIDTALEFGERDHGIVSFEDWKAFYGPGRDRASAAIASPSCRALCRHPRPTCAAVTKRRREWPERSTATAVERLFGRCTFGPPSPLLQVDPCCGAEAAWTLDHQAHDT